jgi:hypothetical protein
MSAAQGSTCRPYLFHCFHVLDEALIPSPFGQVSGMASLGKQPQAVVRQGGIPPAFPGYKRATRRQD